MKIFFLFASKNYILQKQLFQKERGTLVFPLAKPRKTKVFVKPFFFPVSYRHQRFFSRIGKIWLHQQKKWYKTTIFFITKKKRKILRVVLKRIKTRKNRLYIFRRFQRSFFGSQKKRRKLRFKTLTKMGAVKYRPKALQGLLRSKKKAEVVFFAKQKKKDFVPKMENDKKKKIFIQNYIGMELYQFKLVSFIRSQDQPI